MPRTYLPAGDVCPDAAIKGDGTFRLMRQRTGTNQRGRTYRVSFNATDQYSQNCSGTVRVCVPFSQGRNTACEPVMAGPWAHNSLKC